MVQLFCFGKLADTCNQYLTKGKQVYVEGRLSSRTYQTQGRCPEEAKEYRAVVAQSQAEGSFFIAELFHCAVGVKP